MPTLVMDGGNSPLWMRNTMKSVSQVLSNAKYKTIEGQTHMLSEKAVLPIIKEFFN
jgi:hypothetical protein